MRNFVIATALAASLGAAVMGVGSAAYAGCPGSLSSAACAIWQKQNNAPALRGPKKATTVAMRSIAVLSDKKCALVLRKGMSNKGKPLYSFRKASIPWVKTSRGYEATVHIPLSYFEEYDELTLCGCNGHSSWGSAATEYIRSYNVKASDPACTGGDSWCGKRGL